MVGRASALSIETSTKSACSCALIEVVSAFQNKMSNAAALRPSR
jgi:hypothetical protein